MTTPLPPSVQNLPKTPEFDNLFRESVGDYLLHYLGPDLGSQVASTFGVKLNEHLQSERTTAAEIQMRMQEHMERMKERQQVISPTVRVHTYHSHRTPVWQRRVNKWQLVLTFEHPEDTWDIFFRSRRAMRVWMKTKMRNQGIAFFQFKPQRPLEFIQLNLVVNKKGAHFDGAA